MILTCCLVKIISFSFNLQNGIGYLLGCYGEGEGRVDDKQYTDN